MKHYPSMEDAWLDLRVLLEVGQRLKIPTKDLITGTIECLHRDHSPRSEATGDYLQRKARNQARSQRRKALGQCLQCGHPIEPGYALCSRCREKERAYRERRNQIGREAAG